MTEPAVSVIIPCYNVERYLDDCVSSVVHQTLGELDIVLIDDGSTDATPHLVDAWVDKDSRIRAVHQENRGLGAARNEGVRQASGRYLFFLDSDDLLPLDALERMFASAEETGSDIVSGVANKFNGTRSWKSATYRPVFNQNRRRTHLFFEPSLLYDHIACSKLFRTEFWRAQDFEFPEGVLFEDIELITRAHCLARSVDLQSQPTYMWREREDGERSITQDRTRTGSTAARFDALRQVDAFLREHAPVAVWDAHAAKVFSMDVPAYCKLVTDGTPEYLAEFVAAAGALAREVSTDGVAKISKLNQLTWRSLHDGDAQAVEACGHLLVGRSSGSFRAIVRGRALLPRSRRNEAVTHEVRSARKASVRRFGRKVRNRSRWAASKTGGLVLEGINRRHARKIISAEDQDDVQESIDGLLARTRRLEQRARKLGRRVGVLPKPKPRRARPSSLPNPAGLSLAGTLRGHVESPRDFGHTLRFPASPVDVCRAVLLHEQERIPLELPLTEGGFSLDMQRLSRFGSQATLRPGRWIVLALDRLGTAWAATSENPVSINYRDEAAGSEYRLRGDHSGLTCSVASLLPVPDRPARAQTIIREGYRRRAAAGQRSRAVVYECFYGRSVGCHPRAIFEELRQRLPDDVEHVFVTQPGFLHPPTGASTAQRWTRRYWELLQTSPLVVANCELHRSFQKAGFQTVVQTWHGTPLKRIGLDIDSPKFRNEAYQDDLAHQVAQWSFMLSPTTDTDEIFRRAFAFDGDLIPSGSPRNDRLVRNDAAERADIRARIGLDSGDTAILFAPTFRDDSHTTAGYRASPQCDLPTLLATLPESTRVLFRAHSNIRTTEIPWDNDRVINVSDYPDAQDLILAGDLLVTDYSSLMFDWALTGKPVTLFAPDLEQYQGVRDFYYDYLEVMPTAPARTPAQLGAALETALNSPSVDLTEIVERFAGRDDGSATDRVIDEILQRVDFE